MWSPLEDYPTIYNAYIKGKIALEDKHPLFAQLGYYFDPIITDDPKEFPAPSGLEPTICVNAKGKLSMYKGFVEKLSLEQWKFILAHEVGHIITMTCSRFPLGGDRAWWNIASDIVINLMVIDDAKIVPPNMDTLNPLYGKGYVNGVYIDTDKYIDKTTPYVYNDLIQSKGEDEEEDEGSNPDEQGDGDEGDSSGSEDSDKQSDFWYDESGTSTQKGDGTKDDGKGKGKDGCCEGMAEGMSEQERGEWNERLSNAVASAEAKGVGNIPGCLQRFLTELLEPKRDWRKQIRQIASATLKRRWTWKRAGRRTGHTVRTPGRDRDVPEAVLYLDTSGSMDDDQLRRCLSEMAAILKIVGGKGRLLLGDSIIYYDGEVNIAELGNLPVQRGGTDFRVLFNAIRDSDKPEPKLLVGFTDCGGPFPTNPPDYPVIWCKPKDNWDCHSPWGIEIEVDI